MANFAEVRRLLCERYNVARLDGPLAEAIEAGDANVLGELIAEREMYRWRKPIEEALAFRAEEPPAKEVEAKKPEPIEPVLEPEGHYPPPPEPPPADHDPSWNNRRRRK